MNTGTEIKPFLKVKMFGVLKMGLYKAKHLSFQCRTPVEK